MAGSRKSLWAVAAVGIAFLILVTQAIPQTLELISPPAPPPYTVDSEYVRYADDGSQTVEMYSTSYTSQNGGEIILQRTIPEHPFGTAVGRTLDAVLRLLSRLTLPVMISSKELEKIKQSAPLKTVGVIMAVCGDETCLVLHRWFFARADNGPGAPVRGWVDSRLRNHTRPFDDCRRRALCTTRCPLRDARRQRETRCGWLPISDALL